MKLAVHRVLACLVVAATLVPCCLAAGNGLDSLGLNALLSGIGNLFQKGDASALGSIKSAESEPVAPADTANTEEPQREDVTSTPTTTAKFDVLDGGSGGLGPLGNDATPGIDATEPLDLPRSVETVVHTQILVVAPDMVKEVVVSESFLVDETGNESAASHHLLTCRFLLISLLPIVFAAAAAAHVSG
ncbi:hypothetical protein EV175_002501 [Coemansia sp. RSA 1933]|nr:hypothetical protein EV175_002501 [Coemansia sp. RSA 1933]